MFRVIGVMQFLTMASMFGFVWFEQVWLTALTAALLGFFSIPVIPVSMDFACEVAFPVGEATIAGLLLMSGQLMSVVNMIVIVSGIQLQTRSHVMYSGIYSMSLGLLGLVASFIVKEDLVRSKVESEHSNESVLTSDIANRTIARQKLPAKKSDTIDNGKDSF